MNKENVKKAIAIMERVKEKTGVFYMANWQFSLRPNSTIAKTEKEMHQCGNAACFAGWVAVSPEFQEIGGTVDNGIPYLGRFSGHEAIAKWLGIDPELASELCATMAYYSPSFYGKDLEEITPDDVIEKLNELLEE